MFYLHKVSNEFWDIYDKNGGKTNIIKRKGDKLLPGEYHLAIEAWIVNSKGQILVQKRSHCCEVLPNFWGLTTGRLISGESSIDGCLREVKEELGLHIEKHDPFFLRRIFRTDMIWDIYIINKDFSIKELILQKEEVSAAKWVTPSEFTSMIKAGDLFEYPEIYEILNSI